MVEQAAQKGASLILFPECGVTGYRSTAPTISQGDKSFRSLLGLAHAYGIVVAAGFLERKEEGVFISHGVFYPNGKIRIQHKSRLAPVEKEIPDFQRGSNERMVFEVKGVRCAIAICADMAIPNLYGRLAGQGVQLLLSPTAGCGPYDLGYRESSLDDPATLKRYLKDAETVVFNKQAILHSRTHQIAFVCCNQLADNGRDYFHPGHSMIIDSTGELVALLPGSFVFEHLRPGFVVGKIHPKEPRTGVDHSERKPPRAEAGRTQRIKK